jgi:hypothetical protein
MAAGGEARPMRDSSRTLPALVVGFVVALVLEFAPGLFALIAGITVGMVVWLLRAPKDTPPRT